MSSVSSQITKRKKIQYALLAGLVLFALALCALVVIMMLRRGPAVTF